MVRVVYLTTGDRDALDTEESARWGGPVACCSNDGMPIINEAALAKLGMPVPLVSTVYEIEAVT